MDEKFILAENLYEFYKPKEFNVWEGCNDQPEYLSKHMAATDVVILTSLILGRRLDPTEANAIEEVTYCALGYPKCWKGDKKLYFVSKEEIDIKS